MPKGNPGHTKSDAHRQKLREAATRRYANTEIRIQHADRMREVYQQSASLQRMHDASAREKQAATLSELWTTPEYRESVLAARNTPEAKQKLRTAMQTLWATPEYRAQMEQTIHKSRRAHLSPTAQQCLEDPEWLRAQNQTRTLTEIATELGCAQSLLSAQCAAYGIFPVQHHSSYMGGESQIRAYLSQYPDLRVDSRVRHLIPPYEIDVYVPDCRVGIEYHGSYWHSYNHVESSDERRRHLRKYLLARDAGIRLLQFWDFEWANTPDICQSILDTALGRAQSLGARQLTYAEPSRTEVEAFLRAHHIQGACGYKHAGGLYDGSTLRMVMTIGKSRFKAQTWELLRLATHRGYHINGGASRLWSHVSSYVPAGATVYSYADQRFFTGNVYATLGFTYQHMTPPGYQYLWGTTPYSRLQFQKHKLATKLATYDPALTEAENMFHHGYRRLWDAGHAVWVYHQP